MSDYSLARPRRQRRQRPLGTGDPRMPTHKRQGLTRSQLEAAIALQGGACALCRRPITPATARVDHDHELAARHRHPAEQGCPRCFRGVLCHGCNSWLSGFRDSPAFIQRALAYVTSKGAA